MLSSSLSSTQQGKRMQRNEATHKSTDTVEHSLCLPAETGLRNFSRSRKLNFPWHGYARRLGKGRQVPNPVSGISCIRYTETQSEGLSRLRQPAPRERVGPSCCPTPAFIFPTDEITIGNSKAKPIQPPIHAPARPPGAPVSTSAL